MAKTKPLPPEGFDESPEWTEADFERSRPGAEMLPEIFGEPTASTLMRRPGRPKADVVKVPIKLRLDPEVIEHFKAGGPGWQTRINDTLRADVQRQKRAKR